MTKKPKLISIVFFPAIALFMISFCFGADVIGGFKLKVKTISANIRLEPSTTAKVLSQAPQGAILESDQKEGEWYRILIPPQINPIVKYGFLHQSVVEVIEEIIDKQVQVKEETAPQQIQKGVDIPKLTNPKESKPQKENEVESKFIRIKGKGIKVGANMASISVNKYHSSNSVKIKNIYGFAFGGFIDLAIKKIISIQPEIYFTQKGEKQELTGWNLVWTTKRSYLELDILAKKNIMARTAKLIPCFFAGPYFGWLLSSRIEGPEYSGADEHTKGTDFGLVFGGGIEFPFASGKILSEIRYSRSITSTY